MQEMSGRRGRPLTRARGNRAIPTLVPGLVPEPTPVPTLTPTPLLAPATPAESVADLRQEVSELRGIMATMLRHFEHFMAYQGRQEQAPPGLRNGPVLNENISGQTLNLAPQDKKFSNKDWMATSGPS